MSPGVRLSGGQIQRAAVSRMVLRDAELLVFDNVSSALLLSDSDCAVEDHFSPCAYGAEG